MTTTFTGTAHCYFKETLINHYTSPPLPFPARTPPYRVSFFMHLVVNEPGVYTFELDSSWNGALDIEEERVFGSGPFFPGKGPKRLRGNIELSPGVYRTRFSVQALIASLQQTLLGKLLHQSLREVSVPFRGQMERIDEVVLVRQQGCFQSKVTRIDDGDVERCCHLT